MPDQIQEVKSTLELFRYIDYKEVLASLNTPYMWVALGVSAFILFWTFASYRHHMFKISAHGSGGGVLMGVILALIIEAVLIYKFIGFDKVLALIKNREVAERANLGPILGDSIECRPIQSVENYLQTLSEKEAREIKVALCKDVIEDLP